MKFLTLIEFVSPEDFAEVISPETVSWSSLKLDPVVYDHVKDPLVASFCHAIDELSHDFGEVAPSELLSHFGNDITTTLFDSIVDA
jgi:hypothetical protein